MCLSDFVTFDWPLLIGISTNYINMGFFSLYFKWKCFIVAVRFMSTLVPLIFSKIEKRDMFSVCLWYIQSKISKYYKCKQKLKYIHVQTFLYSIKLYILTNGKLMKLKYRIKQFIISSKPKINLHSRKEINVTFCSSRWSMNFSREALKTFLKIHEEFFKIVWKSW